MTEVKVNGEIALPVDKVWELAREFDIGKWAAVESCEVEGQGVGAVRKLAMPGGISLSERLEALDDAAHSFSYSILPGGPLPLDNYLATVELSDANGATRIDWSGRFEPKGIPEEQAIAMVRGIYEGGIKGMRKALGL